MLAQFNGTLRYFCLAFLLAISVPAAGQNQTIHQTERDPGLLYLQQLDQRVADISWRIGAANNALCHKHANMLGINLHNAVQYAPRYRQAAIDTFGFGDGLPAILAIAEASPAAASGLHVGDRIVAINGEPVPPVVIGRAAKEQYSPVAEVMARLERLPADQPAQLDIRRDDRTFTFAIRPMVTCQARVEVVPGNPVNASSNGTEVQIHGGLALWARSDSELAIIIAHELAHNILDHNLRISREKIGTNFFASLGRDGQRLRDMEREADRYGLFLTARAGYDYRIAPDLWRRLSATSGLSGIWATTHPSGASRAQSNRLTVAEIDRLNAAGIEIVP